jgi:exodeoxyribonuclease V beta subunit
LLHEILEEVPLKETYEAAGLDAWRTLPAVASAVETALTRFAFDPALRPEVEALVYQALTTHIPAGPGRTIPGLCCGTRSQREMEFLFPIPEHHHPRLADPRPGKLVIERGYVKGYIDLVVEHEGLVYFADWKADVLDSYEPKALARHVGEQYVIQEKLYVLALVKALRIRNAADYEARFGGLIYVFLRGLRRPGPAGMGLHFARPSWAEVLGYEDELIRRTTSASPRGGPR